MGLFGDDKLQDRRLDALEAHVRKLTETTQQNQHDLAATRIAVMDIQAKLGEIQTALGGKLSVSAIDSSLIELNQELVEAREKSEAAEAAADESWETLQGGARDAYATLRGSIEKAAERLKQG